MKVTSWAANLPHPAVLLDDCPQLRKVIEEMEAGTYPLPDVAVWRPGLGRDLAVRLAKATGASDEQIAEAIAEDERAPRDGYPVGDG